MREVDTVLFDWDGTLLDSAPLAFEAFEKSFRDLGIPLDPEVYERIYSPNWYGMYQALGLPEARWEDADTLWTNHYGEATAPLVPGGRDAVYALRERGYSLGIVTSGSRVRVRRELGALGLDGAFETVVCSEDVVNKKPHPEGLEMAMRHLGRRPSQCCYIGDSPVDVEMGKRAGVRTVGVVSGYPSSRNLSSLHPDFCFESITRILEHLTNTIQACHELHETGIGP